MIMQIKNLNILWDNVLIYFVHINGLKQRRQGGFVRQTGAASDVLLDQMMVIRVPYGRAASS